LYLLVQVVVSLDAVGLVVLVRRVAESPAGQVVRRRDVVGLQLGDDFGEHRYQSIECPRGLALGRAKVRQSVISAVQNSMRVEYHELFIALAHTISISLSSPSVSSTENLSSMSGLGSLSPSFSGHSTKTSAQGSDKNSCGLSVSNSAGLSKR